jgi:predicted porin
LENFEMKKTLVAVAALVATGAFAQVTISGVAEAAIASSGGKRVMSGGTNGTSEVTFGVSEDLGSGLKAMASSTLCFSQFYGEKDNSACGGPVQGITAAAGDNKGPVGTYNSYVGLAGEFGSVKIGQQFSNTFFASALGDTFGRAAVSNNLVGTNLAAQVGNSLNYTSPSMAGASVAYQTTLDQTTGITSFTSWSLNYTAGAFSGAYASSKTGNNTENVVAASYDFGVAKISVGQSTYTNAKSAVGYGVSVPFGAMLFGLGMSSQDTTDATQFGVTYGLSKRTSVYAAQGQKTGVPNTTLLGVRHNF